MYSPPLDKKPVQKTKHLHKIPEKKRIWPCIGSIKYDGVYAYQIIREGDYRIFSATGMQYKSLKHIEESGKTLEVQDVVLIFEVHNSDYAVNIISGKCRDESNQHPELYAVVHDVIPYDDFINGFCNIEYSLRELVALAIHGMHYMHPTSFMIRSEAHADELFLEYTAKGHEGIIGRNPDGYWYGAHKRNEDLWKKKIELSYDLEVTHVFKGAGKYSCTTGTIGCRFRVFGKDDGLLDTVLCSGMTDNQRNTWWADPSSIIGKIVKVDAMTFTKNGLLREPRFKEVRADILTPEF